MFVLFLYDEKTIYKLPLCFILFSYEIEIRKFCWSLEGLM